MNKKILISLSIIGAVAVIAIGGTIAYFSDTETSTGNTFTAGSIDLLFKVEGPQGVWTEVNNAPLFTLGDMKPGDKGEKTVNLVVDNNPACGKVSINVYEDEDNSCTEPELLIDTTCTEIPETAGELNDEVNFAIWEDPNCNNVLDEGTLGICYGYPGCEGMSNQNDCGAYNPLCMWDLVPTPGETILVSGSLTGNEVYSIGELPNVPAAAKCYGIAYCFGAWNGTSCDGSAVSNASQSDSFKADLIIDALQKRNQYDAGCPAVGNWPII